MHFVKEELFERPMPCADGLVVSFLPTHLIAYALGIFNYKCYYVNII